MSTIISASSGKEVVDNTLAVTAVTVDFSVLLMVGFVENTVEPLDRTFTVNMEPVDCATVRLALTDANVKAYGILKVTFPRPVVSDEVSSEHAIGITWVELAAVNVVQVGVAPAPALVST